MKKLLVLLLLPISIFAQYGLADFVVLKDGTDSDYHKLEKVWSVYHQKSIDAGEKIGWSVWKRTSQEDDNDMAADYVIFNQFSSKEQLENSMKNFNMDKATGIMKAGLKGEMSSNTISKIINKDIKKQVRTYTLAMLDATPLTGGDLKIGDKMTFAPMIQKTDDYEKAESSIYKPHVLNQIMKGQHRWWAFTKVIDRNENAYENITHITWNVPVENAKRDDFFVQNDFITKKLGEVVQNSREMMKAQELTLVYTSN